MPGHDVQPDGYCNTCRRHPCIGAKSIGQQVAATAGQAQLDRIEALQRQIARKLGIEVSD